MELAGRRGRGGASAAAAAEGARLGRPRSASRGPATSPWGPAPLLARAPRHDRLAWPSPRCSVPPCCCRRLSAAPVSGGAWRAPPAGASWTGSTRWAAGCGRAAPRWGRGSRGLPAGPSCGVGPAAVPRGRVGGGARPCDGAVAGPAPAAIAVLRSAGGGAPPSLPPKGFWCVLCKKAGSIRACPAPWAALLECSRTSLCVAARSSRTCGTANSGAAAPGARRFVLPVRLSAAAARQVPRTAGFSASCRLVALAVFGDSCADRPVVRLCS